MIDSHYVISLKFIICGLLPTLPIDYRELILDRQACGENVAAIQKGTQPGMKAQLEVRTFLC